MYLWICLIIYSAVAGLLVAKFSKSNWGLVLAGLIPWLSLLVLLLYYEYCVPYQGGGASMWPVAQLFAGTVAALVGGGVFIIIRVRQRKM
jgi:hypothetical protein